MKLQFQNELYLKAVLFKQMLQKIVKSVVGKDDDPFGNSCVIL